MEQVYPIFLFSVLKSSNTVVKEEKDLEILYENIKDGQSNSTGDCYLNKYKFLYS